MQAMSEHDTQEKPARRAPLQGRSQETVARILAATTALLGRGIAVESMTTAQIAAEAGLSVGALYRFFADKQAIVDAIAVTRMEAFQEALATRMMFAMPDSPQPFLAAVIDAFAEYLLAHPDLRMLAFGGPGGSRAISRSTRDAQQGSGQIAGMVKEFLTEAYELMLDAAFDFRLQIAIEIGDRLLAHALEQPDAPARERVLAEMKVLLASYLFPPDHSGGG
jgi:AcrR family transcriptional regulator